MKTAFLFGAGAETGFGLSSGSDFARKILLSRADDMISINKAIKTYYKGRKEVLSDWYPTYAAEGWNESQLLRASIKRMYLEDRDKEHPMVKEEVKRLMEPINAAEKEAMLNEHTCYMGLADERYHTLIDPSILGPKCFWSVVNCYTRAYLLIACQMLGVDIRTAADEYYAKILNDPAGTYKQLVRAAEKKKDCVSYYKLVREKSSDSFVITTNYTPYAEVITNQETINIHGSFALFESAHELRVYDVSKEADLPSNEVLFPYISIQGGVKPIVERKQMQCYGKLINILENVNQLIIVGYKINPDDNHLNSVIRSFLVEDKKKVVYFDYDDEHSDESEKAFDRKTICKKLRIPDANDYDLEYIKITSKDAYTKFAQYLTKN